MARRVIVVLVALGLAVAGCSKGTPKYSKANEGVFLASCNPDKDPALDSVCRCAYDEVQQRYTYEQFVDLDKQLQADEKDVPKELVDIIAGCAAPSSSSSSTDSASSDGSSSDRSSSSSSSSSSRSSSSSSSSSSRSSSSSSSR